MWLCIIYDDVEVSRDQAKGGTRSNLLLHALKCGGGMHEGEPSYLTGKGNMAEWMAMGWVLDPTGVEAGENFPRWVSGLETRILAGLGLGRGFDLWVPHRDLFIACVNLEGLAHI